MIRIWICDKCGANYIDVSHQEPSVLREELELRKVKQQLAIAVEALDKVATYMTCDEVEIREIQPNFCADQAALDTVNEAMDKIREFGK